MTDQEIQKRMALLLGWKILDPPEKISGRGDYSFLATWVSPSGIKLKERSIPPWPTDDGTALKSLREWCHDHGCWSMITLYENRCRVQIFSDKPDKVLSRTGHNDLARAICDAMIAAHKSMEGTKHE